MLNYQNIIDLRRCDHSSAPFGELYALVDHAGVPGLAKKLDQRKATWISLFANSKDEGAMLVAPLLFKVDDEHRMLLKWLCKQGSYASSILFLASPEPITELAQRLTARLDASLPNDTDIFLRFFDGRVFENLVSILSVPQKKAFLSVADNWWLVTRQGQLHHYKAVYLGSDSNEIPLQISSQQLNALVDAAEPDKIAQLLEENVPKEFQGLPTITRHDFILRHMRAARLVGILEVYQIALYCALALLYGEYFSKQEIWAAALNEVSSGKLDLPTAVAQIESQQNELGL
ncbi:DUF4123 domain-containing protein [Massilia glaciei]|uniref:DUF4123 domain-containing protein n=1 Tax=Massilia glaciei TaxID=1524097 RepID=A0A2U2HP52_9BURK|nr:DUF4123 domain-containing protein [Massilia glaciei]PWF49291.1 DUF4123 domain-containing protein [Massilia glaciei]